jgi:hypothetical protein
VSLRHLNPSVGASFSLSFLVVATAAVALNPALDRIPKPAAGADEIAATETDPGRSAGSAAPDFGPVEPAAGKRSQTPTSQGEVAILAQPDQARLTRVPERSIDQSEWTPREPARAERLKASAVSPGSATSRSSLRRQAPGKRRSEFFFGVREGETLTDVARRLYGSADAAEALWQVNRDHVSRPDTPLPSGTPLRTP